MIAFRHRRPVLVVDDDAETRSLVAASLEPVGIRTIETANGLEAARSEVPALVAVELCLPDLSGYEVCDEIRRQFGSTVSIVLMSDRRVERLDRVAALLLGADEYMVKPLAIDQFVRRARAVVGRAVPAPAHPASVLTPRELEILRLLAEGFEQQKISALLSITPKTVGTHIERILQKLDARSRAKAIALAYRSGLMDDQVPVRGYAGSEHRSRRLG